MLARAGVPVHLQEVLDGAAGHVGAGDRPEDPGIRVPRRDGRRLGSRRADSLFLGGAAVLRFLPGSAARRGARNLVATVRENDCR